MVWPDGQYLMLFMAALLLIWLTDEQNKKEFTRFSLVMLLVLLFPPTAGLLVRYQTAFYSQQNIWKLLPLTALSAYALVFAQARILSAFTRTERGRQPVFNRKRERLYEGVVLAALAAFLCLSGTLSLARTVTERRERLDGLPQEAAILTFLNVPKDDFVYLLAPDEVSSWARIYNGNLLLPYGRDLYEPELTAYLYDTYDEEMLLLHDWVNSGFDLWENEERAKWVEADFINYCAEAGYHYLIFSYDRYNGALAEALADQEAYRESDTTRLPYVIYELQ